MSYAQRLTGHLRNCRDANCSRRYGKVQLSILFQPTSLRREELSRTFIGSLTMWAGIGSLFQASEAPPPGAFSTNEQWSDQHSTYIPLGEGGRYLLDKTRDGFIGKGASALVYRGRDQKKKCGEGHMVAIKVGGVPCRSAVAGSRHTRPSPVPTLSMTTLRSGHDR